VTARDGLAVGRFGIGRVVVVEEAPIGRVVVLVVEELVVEELVVEELVVEELVVEELVVEELVELPTATIDTLIFAPLIGEISIVVEGIKFHALEPNRLVPSAADEIGIVNVVVPDVTIIETGLTAAAANDTLWSCPRAFVADIRIGILGETV
jgi:hypothetical protein